MRVAEENGGGQKKELETEEKKNLCNKKKKKMRDSSVCGQKFEELDVARPGDRAVI